jgi:guanine deaminase
MSTIYIGALVSPKSLTEYTRSPSAVVCVSKRTGVIEWIENMPASLMQDVLAKYGLVDVQDVDIVELKHGEFLMPGFIDTHTVSTGLQSY